MHLTYRNVNEAFRDLVRTVQSEEVATVRTPSRVGEVIQIVEPMTITYKNPRERVLFNKARDANPFFHVFEALWMIAGRNDLAPLQYFVSTFDQFSDDGYSLNGAYGYRWRAARGNTKANPNGSLYTEGVDQLNVLVDHLKNNPTSRRAVLSMWNVRDDLLKVDTSKDVCCNLVAMFSIRKEPNKYTDSNPRPTVYDPTFYLDMTVVNRSNDMIWGMLGANVVHFSFLQEYLAARIGVQVGVYNQFTNNLHVYVNRWQPDEWLKEYASYWQYPHYARKQDDGHNPIRPCRGCTELGIPLVHDPEKFEEEVHRFIDEPEGSYSEPFLRTVAGEMFLAFRHHKERDYVKALEAVERIASEDWRHVCRNWINKRKANYESRYKEPRLSVE